MNHNFSYDDIKFSTLEDLETEINKIKEINLAKFGKISEEFLTALDTQVKSLYKEVIAKICGISKEEVTDEYIKIALEKIPKADKFGNPSNEVRSYYDNELKRKLEPLIERDRNRKNEAKKEEPENKTTDKLLEIFNKYWESNKIDNEEDKKRKYYELREEAKQIAAEILGVQPSEIKNSLAHYILEGFPIKGFPKKELEDDETTMRNVPITEEQIKALYESSKDITIIFEEQPEEEIDNTSNFHL